MTITCSTKLSNKVQNVRLYTNIWISLALASGPATNVCLYSVTGSFLSWNQTNWSYLQVQALHGEGWSVQSKLPHVDFHPPNKHTCHKVFLLCCNYPLFSLGPPYCRGGQVWVSVLCVSKHSPYLKRMQNLDQTIFLVFFLSTIQTVFPAELTCSNKVSVSSSTKNAILTQHDMKGKYSMPGKGRWQRMFASQLHVWWSQDLQEWIRWGSWLLLLLGVWRG